MLASTAPLLLLLLPAYAHRMQPRSPGCRRHELPTDDQQYERRKEREREEAEERRGAENAVSHNEFLVRRANPSALVGWLGWPLPAGVLA